MKYVAVLILAIALANADLLSPKFKQFMQLKQEAGFAIDAVMDVLNGLKQSALDERDGLDDQHTANSESYQFRINQLTGIKNTNRLMYDQAIANREFVEQEIVNTANYIDFIHHRFEQIHELVVSLQDERCEASLVFVTRCREHYEALNAVGLLKQDLADWEAEGMPVSLAEIKTMKSFNKLSAYTHMFKKQAMNSFLALTNQGTQDFGEHVATKAEVGDDFVDNKQGALELEGQVSVRDNTEETILQKLLRRLDGFVEHLHESMQDLIKSEIRAGRDTVDFIQASESETHLLQVELDRYEVYAAKCENDIVLAEEMEREACKAWEVACEACDSCNAEWEITVTNYMIEVDRLRSDVEVVDEVIKIFLDELQGIDDIIRNQQYDEVGVVDDDRFSQGVFRNTNTDAGEYTGQANVEGAVNAGLL